MGLFRSSSSFREQQLHSDIIRIRRELIEERGISDMLYGVIIADPCECDVPEDNSTYGPLLYEALSAYHRNRHRPITGRMEGN
jgi:hypothetical protein